MKDAILHPHKKRILFVTIFLIVNIIAIILISKREMAAISSSLSAHAESTQEQFSSIMKDYERSFQLLARMMSQEIENEPDPDAIWDYLKSIDAPLLEIEGKTFDGLYMYYQGRYLYSWDTPYSEYEDTGYVATERPWYKAAVEAKGKIVFTPPYMSYANHYILTTISQLQPDGETVFAYDIKMGDIQNLVSTLNQFDEEQIMIFDSNGTVIGSTNADYLGGDLYASLEDVSRTVEQAKAELGEVKQDDREEAAKTEDKKNASEAFYKFRQEFDEGFGDLKKAEKKVVSVKLDGKKAYGFLLSNEDFNFLIMAPMLSILEATMEIWLVPLLIVELLLIYILGRISKEQKNHELKAAYIELGQIQKRLEIALLSAQKAAAVDDLTGMMNFKYFRKAMIQALESMGQDDRGILLMIDGDRFKQVNDNYGHGVGDEVIKLSAQMIIGRIRTIDLASRLHGDEFAIFVSNTTDYDVAKGIMEDINRSLMKEAANRNIPSITLSAGAVIAKHGDNYMTLSKEADEALYEAKITHNGAFAQAKIE